MKKTLPMLALLGLLLFACRKSSQNDNSPSALSEQTYDVTIRVQDSLTSTQSIMSADPSSGKPRVLAATLSRIHNKYLRILIYPATALKGSTTGKPIYDVEQDSTNAGENFGQITTKLKALNSYQIYVIAYNNHAYVVNSTTSTPTVQFKDPKSPVGTTSTLSPQVPDAELYVASKEITVTSTGVNATLVLSRAVAQVHLVLTDKTIPSLAKVQGVKLIVLPEVSSIFNLATGSAGSGAINTKLRDSSTVLFYPTYSNAEQAYTATAYVLPCSYTSLLLESGGYKRPFTITGNVFSPDTKYTIKGSLFTTGQNVGIGQDTTWKTATSTTTFSRHY